MSPLENVRLLNDEIVACKLCTRLVEWRESVALEKRKQFRDESYWGKPVPYFGDFEGDLLILGLAPAAHGANRTGRMFTGDRSGDFLFAALFRAGLANQPHSTHAGDGLLLNRVMVAATCHCAPPDNKPLPSEVANCSRYLLNLLGIRNFNSVLCLGSLAWNHLFKLLGEKPPSFSHGANVRMRSGVRAVASYHPSQQNTFTGRLTPEMLDAAIRIWAESEDR